MLLDDLVLNVSFGSVCGLVAVSFFSFPSQWDRLMLQRSQDFHWVLKWEDADLLLFSILLHVVP